MNKNHHNRFRRALPVCLYGAVALGWVVSALGTDSFAVLEWAAVEPIFRASCVECHGPEKMKGNFRADARQEVVRGRGREPWILPGDSEHSPLVILLSGQTTTRKAPEKHRLSAGEMEVLRQWIEAGAR